MDSGGNTRGDSSANWPIYATLSPSGTADDSIAIQNAINAAPARSVVLLRPGVYRIHRDSIVGYNHTPDNAGGVYECGLYLNKSVALRGSGPDRTTICYGDGANIISVGNTYLSSSQVRFLDVRSGAVKGSSSLELASADGVTADAT